MVSSVVVCVVVVVVGWHTGDVWCGELLAMFAVDGALCRIHPHKPDKAGGSLGISGG